MDTFSSELNLYVITFPPENKSLKRHQTVWDLQLWIRKFSRHCPAMELLGVQGYNRAFIKANLLPNISENLGASNWQRK